MKTEFYNLLNENDDFCRALGKVMLAASKLEIELKKYLRIQGKVIPEKKSTLGNLIKILKENKLLTINGETHFNQINIQRNYLIHNLYASFVGEVEDWLLPIEDLIPEDVEVYIEKTELTAHNFGVYSKIVREAIERYENKNSQIITNITPLM